ncbi:chloride channel protein [Burkholderia cenocepacia]|uniref:chloride channel protein n=1 Tax=Burkholderia cenocepacia TaxID=95486 RepID=UPI000980E4CE|nr:chloride channel protein [Burkholderia cenocepacia]AQQ24431.1 chloride channel protein [Burkholderia cenocepacia]ONV81885.1 chloride channel protein [Burkholderia cenocepacia]ONW11643.1 chloride channel protein [Burkholderia cenocepacia]ONW16076.1 chloride channel protein [Burkholderia cenocepacia]ONW41892.1 chloride channel protein [Burkholderia cenocepacia]
MRLDLPSAPAASSPPVSPFARMAVVTVLTGIGAGLGGMLLALLLHAIQHLAYGYGIAHVIGSESFLSGVTGAEPLRRLAVLTVCGIVAGGGWWALYRYGRPLVSIRRAVRAADPRMPFVSTTVHALLQIVTVALGSPLGREVAPREIGSLLAGRFAHAARLTPDDCRLMVACGAGAGLAAVYNVPLGGAIFVLEVLLGTFEMRALIVAVVTSAIAAIVAWLGLGNEHQYTVPAFVLSTPLVAWSIVCGPLFGFAAYGFVRLTTRARANAPKDWRLPVFALLSFAVIGVLSMGFPQLLGNGKGPASLGFDGTLTIGLAAVLLVLKVLIEAGSLRAGAEGGLLTPGLANGALLGVVLGGLWSIVWPGASLGGCALIGATAFLAASMQMPITAVVLLLEFTRANHDCLVPTLLAVAGSLVAYRLAQKLVERRATAIAAVSTPEAVAR